MENLLQNNYTDFFVRALDNVGKEYYKVKTTYGEIVRERVFCYELYHQMRMIQDKYELTNISLSAEIDKRGHNGFKRRDQKNPDFVFHQYGTFKRNEIVIEVKGSLGRGIFKDFETLSVYCNRYQYKHAYFILYNSNVNQLIDYISANKEYAKQRIKWLMSHVTIICKKGFDSSCEVYNAIELFTEI
ncbi:hypothetical protein [Bacillus sp. REN16]|uniref:hypothetical protein n=1 Tax=Bacillus sp. REN16 TaxID=2887296 RepID=UPI001E4DC3DE|nr:hypothetical protein [Bacillus sp. REN16]MCC3359422.1 hypothetical protein [Bacillus sp. REN16]